MLARNRKLKRRLASALLILSLGIGYGCATRNIQQTPSGRFQVQPGGFNQFTPEQEIQLGREAARQVKQEMPLLPDNDPISQYVRQLGQQLAAKAPGEKWPFEFHVVNVKEINAFALPGGPIFVHMGTVRAADSEGQLAGVLAHEISHVVLRHGTQQASKQVLAQIPLAVLGATLPQNTLGQLARLGVSFGAQSVFLKYSRDAEREADLLGSQIMYDAGFNPYDMVEFFSKLEKQGGPGVPEFLSDHPNPGNRAQLVSQAIAKYPKKQFKRDDPRFEQVRARAEKLNPPSMQEVAKKASQGGSGGQVRNVDLSQIRPSNDFRALDHSVFQIAYPSNWEVFGNQNSTVTIAPRAGVSESAIAYGVMISGYKSQQANSLESATEELIQTLRQGNPQLQVAGSGKEISVSGTRGLTVALAGPSPLAGEQGQLTERDQLVTVPRGDGTLVFLLFIAPERDFQALQPAYEKMLQSFRLKP